MASRWYVQLGPEQRGPLKTVELRQLANEGGIGPETFVRRGEQGEWVEASRVMGLLPGKTPHKPAEAVQQATSPTESTRPEGSTPAAKRQAAPRATEKTPKKLPVAQAIAEDSPMPAGTTAAAATPAVAGPAAAASPAAPVAVAAPVARVASPAPNVSAVQASDSPSPIVKVSQKGGRGRRRGQRRAAPLTLFAVLAVVLILTASFGVAGVAIYVWRAGAEASTAQSSDESSARGSLAAAKQKASPAKTDGPQRPVSEESAAGRFETLLSSIEKWRDASKVLVKPTPGAQCRVASVRLVSPAELEQILPMPQAAQKADASDTATSAIEAGLGGDTPVARVAAKPTSSADSDAPSGPKRMVIELQISNLSSQEALHYTGLNGLRDPQAAALLLDDLGHRYEPLPQTDAGASRRISEIDIAPAHTLIDVLVFPAPEEGFEFVRLALPNASIGRVGGVGFEIPRTMVTEAPAAEDKVAAAETPSSAEADTPSAGKDSAPAEKPVETIEDLKRSISESVKGDGSAPKAAEGK